MTPEEKKEYYKMYYEKNKAKIQKYKKAWHQNNQKKNGAAVKARKKLWKQNNKEKIKIYNEEHKEHIKSYQKEYRKKYYEEHKKEISKNAQLYYKENKDYISIRLKTYYENNVEKIKNRAKIYYENNKEKFLYNTRKRQCRKQSAYVEHVPTEKLFEYYGAICFYCGASIRQNERASFHIDHFFPLSKGGKHEFKNLRLSCPKCNREKGSKNPFEFIKRQEAVK